MLSKLPSQQSALAKLQFSLIRKKRIVHSRFENWRRQGLVQGVVLGLIIRFSFFREDSKCCIRVVHTFLPLTFLSYCQIALQFAGQPNVTIYFWFWPSNSSIRLDRDGSFFAKIALHHVSLRKEVD